MYNSLGYLHSIWAYLMLLIIILATINALKGYFSKGAFKQLDFRLTLFTLIVTHIQLILGLFLYIYSPNAMGAIKNSGMGTVMKDSAIRFSSVEHPLMMILAVILITIGYSKHKKKEGATTKFKTIAIYYSIALILVLSRIPWSTWFN